MKNFIKALWGGVKGEGDAPGRTIDEPLELQKGDYIKLNDSFALPLLLRGQTMQITKVNTYLYGYEQVAEFNLRGEENRTIFMNYEDNDGDPFIGFSVKLKRKEIDTIFGKGVLKKVYNGNQTSLSVENKLDGFELWLADKYEIKESAKKGQFFERDFRGSDAPTSGGEPLTYTELWSSDEKFAVEIEIWDEDEIDIMITLIRPITDVHEMWPKS
ncbi:MAG: hypothetical protein ACC707_01835 [Thiohalomonadales bacterium]